MSDQTKAIDVTEGENAEPSIENNDQIDESIYRESVSLYRYENNLRWQRLKAMMTVEAAMLASLYSMQLNPLPRVVVAAFGFFLVFILTGMAVRAIDNSLAHLKRMKAYEKRGTLEFEPPRTVLNLTQVKLNYGAYFLINVFNLVVVGHVILQEV